MVRQPFAGLERDGTELDITGVGSTRKEPMQSAPTLQSPTHAVVIARQTKGHKIQVPVLPQAAHPVVTSDAYTVARSMLEHGNRFQVSRRLILSETGLSRRRFDAALKHLRGHNYMAVVPQRAHGRLCGSCFAFSPDGEAHKLPQCVLHYSVDRDSRETIAQSKKRRTMRRKFALGRELRFSDGLEVGEQVVTSDTSSETLSLVTAEPVWSEAPPVPPYNDELISGDEKESPYPFAGAKGTSEFFKTGIPFVSSSNPWISAAACVVASASMVLGIESSDFPESKDTKAPASKSETVSPKASHARHLYAAATKQAIMLRRRQQAYAEDGTALDDETVTCPITLAHAALDTTPHLTKLLVAHEMRKQIPDHQSICPAYDQMVRPFADSQASLEVALSQATLADVPMTLQRDRTGVQWLQTHLPGLMLQDCLVGVQFLPAYSRNILRHMRRGHLGEVEVATLWLQRGTGTLPPVTPVDLAGQLYRKLGTTGDACRVAQVELNRLLQSNDIDEDGTLVDVAPQDTGDAGWINWITQGWLPVLNMFENCPYTGARLQLAMWRRDCDAHTWAKVFFTAKLSNRQDIMAALTEGVKGLIAPWTAEDTRRHWVETSPGRSYARQLFAEFATFGRAIAPHLGFNSPEDFEVEVKFFEMKLKAATKAMASVQEICAA